MEHRPVQPNSAEQRRLSNLGHLIEGIFFAFVSILALLSNTGIAVWAANIWQITIGVAAIVLLTMIYLLHPVGDWPTIWQDAQQRQHTIIAFLLFAGGLAEAINKSASAVDYVWPAALLVIGGLFLVHKQHGASQAAAKAVRLHRILGLTIIAASVLRGMEVISKIGMFGILWPLALLVAAVQLILYREPEGAFEQQGSHGQT